MPHTLRFMIDNEMTGMSWLDIKKGSYGIRSRQQKKTSCQLEIDVFDYRSIVFHKKCEGEF
jgi:DNA polymerase delta subunit 1